jgi:hypothetical protein
VTYAGPAHAMATVRPDDLHRSVTNLVENAVRFGAEATIRLRVDPDDITIDIEDDGPGISDVRKANVLEPFVRGDDARNMDEAEGFGLGLSIANAVVLAHGGALSLHDRKPRGLVVRIRLPVHPQRRISAASEIASVSWLRRQRRGLAFHFRIDRDRLETIIAGVAGPQIGRAARRVFDPVGFCDRLPALGAGISARQIAGIESAHGASPLL